MEKETIEEIGNMIGIFFLKNGHPLFLLSVHSCPWNY